MIVPFKTIEYQLFSSGFDVGTKIVYQQNAFCNNDLFFDYVRDVICEEVERRRTLFGVKKQRAVLLLDQCRSHCSNEVKAILKSHRIEIVYFPSHCSHLIQPLDLSLFGIMKQKFTKKLWGFDFESSEQKERVIRALMVIEAFHVSSVPCNVVACFRKIGLYPGVDDKWNRSSFIDSKTINLKLRNACDNINFEEFDVFPTLRRKTVILKEYKNMNTNEE